MKSKRAKPRPRLPAIVRRIKRIDSCANGTMKIELSYREKPGLFTRMHIARVIAGILNGSIARKK